MKTVRGMCFLVAVCMAVCGALGQALPAGWIDVPFGTYTAGWEGWASYDMASDTFTIAGSGNDLSGDAADGGRFVFQPMSGDCEIEAEIYRPFCPGSGYAARAGLHMRARNDRGSLFSFFGRRHGENNVNMNANLLSSSARRVLNTPPEVKNQAEYDADWILARLIRQGDTTRAYFKSGGAWQLFQTHTVALGEAINVGLVVSRHSSNQSQLMTNDFRAVTVRSLVAATPAAGDSIDLTWAIDLPGIETGWFYTYTLTRTAEGGSPETLGENLLAAPFTDTTTVAGIAYRYTVTAVPTEQPGLDTPPAVLIGTSGSVCRQASAANLVPGLPSGLFAAYYTPVDAVLPFHTRIDSSVTNVVSQYPGGISNAFRAVFNASLCVDVTDTYTFFTDTDDGVRLWIGETLVLDNWYNNRWKASSTPVLLEAGRVAPFRAEYYQNNADRAFTLTWRRTGDASVVPVPETAFTPVTLPWRHTGIGGTALNGNAQFSPTAITVTTGGNDFQGAADAGHFIWRDLTGDFDLTARLDTLTGSGGRRAGITARTGLTAGASALTLLAAPDAGTYTATALARDTAHTAPAMTVIPTGVNDTAPLWFRVTRTGLELAVWFRADAATGWTLAQTMTLPSGTGTLYAGPVASADDTATPAVATFGDAHSATFASESLSPTDDAFMRVGNTLNGSASELYLKRNIGGITEDTQREGFMRFNVSGRANIRSAILRLYLNSWEARAGYPQEAVQEVMIRAFHNFHWSENTATWDNAPGGLRLPTVFLAKDDPSIVTTFVIPPAGRYVEIDATAAVRQAALGSGDLTFNLVCLTVIGGSPINFSSKEHGTAAQRPLLVLQYDAPTGLSAGRGPDAGSVLMTWDSFPTALGYTIHRAAAAEGPFAPVGTSAQPYFKDTGLTPGQTVFYRVSATVADGETDLSVAARAVASEAAGTVLVAAEDAWVQGNDPKGIPDRQFGTVNHGGDSLLTIKYNVGDPSYHREAYFLFNGIADLAQAERVVLRVTPQTQESYVKSGVIAGLPMPIQVARLPSNNWSESTVTFDTPPAGHVPPMYLQTVFSPKDRVAAELWAPNAAVDIDVTEMVREAARVNADGKVSFVIIRTDPAGGDYNLNLYSKEQADASRRPQLVYTFGRPDAPTVAVAGDRMVVSWAPYRGATGYVVRRAESAAGPYAVVGETSGTSMTDMAAESGVAYWYTLAAVTASGETDASMPAVGCADVPAMLEPLADTMIESNGGTTTDTNHGSAPTLNLKRNPLREDFFKFDVRGMENVARARFRVSANTRDNAFGPVNIVVRHGDFGDWPEDGVTFNHPPAGHMPPSVATAAKGANEVTRILHAYMGGTRIDVNWMEADVTDVVRAAARNGTRYLTLFLTGDDTLQHNNGALTVGTRENETAELRPMLLTSGRLFGTPDGLALDVVEDGNGFEVSWRPVTGAVRYIVTRQGPNDAEPVLLSDAVTGTSLSDVNARFWNERDYTYTVTAVHGDGTMSAAGTVTAPLVRVFEQEVVADTFIQAGVNAHTTNGLVRVVSVKCDTLDLQREGLFRVSLDGAPAFTGAEFQMRIESLNPGRGYRMVLREMEDSGWTEWGEGAATWASIFGAGALGSELPAPGDASLVGVQVMAPEMMAEDMLHFDVTGHLKAARARGASSVVLHLYAVDPDGQNLFHVHSRESTAVAYRPKVVYTMPKRPAAGTVMLLK